MSAVGAAAVRKGGSLIGEQTQGNKFIYLGGLAIIGIVLLTTLILVLSAVLLIVIFWSYLSGLWDLYKLVEVMITLIVSAIAAAGYLLRDVLKALFDVYKEMD